MRMLMIFIVLSISIPMSLCAQNWYKGNTHTHTTFSDGDTPAQSVVEWYNGNGYNFLVITDHNKTMVPKESIKSDNLRKDFILLPGNEVSIGNLHYTALGVVVPASGTTFVKRFKSGELNKYVPADTAGTKIHNSQIQINGILASGAIPIINHPNFVSGISEQEMAKLHGVHHMELYNAHPRCANFGNKTHVAVEKKWDYLLSKGLKIYGVGSDDAHNLQKRGAKYANPGRSWIMVNAPELDQATILSAIERGDYYVSTGVELKSYNTDRGKISLVVDKTITERNLADKLGDFMSSDKGIEGCSIEVVGKDGAVLCSTSGYKLKYKIAEIDKYIRVRVSYCLKEDGIYKTYYAWAQPLFETKK